MTQTKKIIYCFFALVIGVILGFFVLVADVLNRESYVSNVSKSGRYKVEAVRAGPVLVSSNLIYLRFTDLEQPGKIYRTPLMSKTSLGMQSYEDKKVVGITWVDFDKSRRVFVLSIPNWKEHWANFFISNIAYEVIPN
ncbi:MULTISPECIES: hypothetical protein [unclassified Pseudomonas]|uniref:hypothetical protein n=1 Tax=unclassified Pseudomonas TaxID=196821 RepID=UPI000CD27DA7|nr:MULTISPECIES: hypothetical protein [unclassified Pseudomonas]POA34901.1 hypothetical protein C1887_02125 [Pseudomonas sp. GW456-R21]POA70858.1 hypothetical protein C1884_01675 [Pseudomonas sp. GW460-R15]